MIDNKKLEDELSKLPEDSIVLLETSAEHAFKASIASIKLLADRHDKAVILSASRPYSNLVSHYKKNKIDTKKMFILDCISKKHDSEKEDSSVLFIENPSSLT